MRDEYGLGQVRVQPFTARPSAHRLPDERIPAWRCCCLLPAYKRHASPWLCLDEDRVLAYWLAHPATTHRVVRMMAWLATEFER